jgi:hypothetical protein
MGLREEDRESLRDLDSVRVAVESSPTPQLPGEVLRARIEAQVRAAGIRIQGMGEFPTGDPHLRLVVSVSPPRDGLVACDVQLDFVQIVFLRRNPAVTFNRAQTWKADAAIVLAPEPRLADALQSELSRQVDQFIADYRAVNG